MAKSRFLFLLCVLTAELVFSIAASSQAPEMMKGARKLVSTCTNVQPGETVR